MFTEIAIGIITLAVAWLFKTSIEAGKEIAVLKQKLKTSEDNHQEFKKVMDRLTEIVRELTIAIEILKK